MNYSDFMDHIEILSNKVSFSRDDMLDIIDYISININFATVIVGFSYIDYYEFYLNFKSILNDLMIRFGPRSSDE